MITFTANEARTQFAELLNQAAYGKEHVLITRSGKPLAAVIPYNQYQAFQEWQTNQQQQEDQKAVAEFIHKHTEEDV